jgi:uncharacterized protein (DUF1330 family)
MYRVSRAREARSVPAYVFFEIRVLAEPTEEQQRAYDDYRARVPELVHQHGGRYLARAWQGEALEGAPAADRFHLAEFPDAQAARTFWTSPEYLSIKPGRAGVVDVRAVLISSPEA